MKIPRIPAALMILCGAAAFFLGMGAFADEPSEKNVYAHHIIIDAKVNKASGGLVGDFKHWLEEMTHVQFDVSNVIPASVGSGVYLLTADSPLVSPSDRARLEGKGLEAFLLRGTSDHLLIVANDWRGLSHGVYTYLEQLGMRWLLPGSNWTVVPSRSSITWTVDRVEAPAFWSRGWAGTGGFYSNVLGRQFTGTADRKKGIVDCEVDETAWMRRLRTGGQRLGHAEGEGFVSDPKITPILETHPEYLAKLDGQHSPLYTPVKTPTRSGEYILDAVTHHFRHINKGEVGTHDLNIIVKLNAGNAEAVDLFAEWIMRRLREARKSPEGYAIQTVSVEPSDGGGEGNNYDELKAQGVGDGSESDQEFYIGNYCARKVRAEFPDVSVIMLAYCTRTDPPSFPLEPNFIVQPAFAFRSGRKTANLTNEEWLTLWATKAVKMAFYTYWSIPDWEHDIPCFNYLDVARMLRDYQTKNIRALHAESTWSGGAMGIGQYVAAHVMWDPKVDEKALIADWYEKAFGPAQAPMRRLLERWATTFRLISPELGVAYRDIDEAMRLAAQEPAVLARVDDYARYLHYLRLRMELLNAAKEQKDRAASAVAEHVFNIHESHMVHTTRIFDLLAQRGYPALKQEFYLHGARSLPDDPPDGPAWARIHPLSHAEIAALVADGLRSYPMADFVERTYVGSLVALKPIAWVAPQGDPWGPSFEGFADLDVDLIVPTGLTAVPLRVSRFTDNVITATDADGHSVFTHTVIGLTDRADKSVAWDEVSIPVSPGRYKVHFHPRGGRATGFFEFETWRGVPLHFGRFLRSKASTGALPLYFFVPHNTPKLVLYLPDTGDFDGNLAPKVSDSSGGDVKFERRDNGKLLVANVPPGQDGKVWSIRRVCSPVVPMEMLTVPQAFSQEPGTLMLPDDALR